MSWPTSGSFQISLSKVVDESHCSCSSPFEMFSRTKKIWFSICPQTRNRPDEEDEWFFDDSRCWLSSLCLTWLQDLTKLIRAFFLNTKLFQFYLTYKTNKQKEKTTFLLAIQNHSLTEGSALGPIILNNICSCLAMEPCFIAMQMEIPV